MKRLLALIICLSIPIPSLAALSDNLISCWTLDEASGNRADSFGSNTLTDTNAVGSATGKISNAAGGFSVTKALDGGNILPASGNNLTFQFWVKINSTLSSDKFVISKGVLSSNYDFALYLRNTGLYTMFGNANTLADFASTSWNVDTNWHHIILTYNGSGTWTIYQDNGTADTVSITAGNTAVSFDIGNLQTSLAFGYDGLIDEFAVWSRVISSGERTQLYNSGSGTSCANIISGGAAATLSPQRLLQGVGK